MITKTGTRGGAAAGATNLLRSLEAVGVKVTAVFADAASNLQIVRKAERIIERTIGGTDCHFMRLGPSSLNVAQLVKMYDPDVVQLCDISGNVVSFRSLNKLKTPVFHRLSDLWPYGGAYHYPWPSTNKPSQFSIRSRIAARVFDQCYAALPSATIICPSRWLFDQISLKPRLNDVHIIRNAVGFSPSRKLIRNSHLGSEVGLGFVSSWVEDPRKGFWPMIRELQHAYESGVKFKLHVFGKANASTKRFNYGFPINFLPPFRVSERSAAFSIFDILICPSVLDNSPNVVCEAFSEGVPVIGQSGTGIDSYITDCDNGYLHDFKSYRAEPYCLGRKLDSVVASYSEFSRAAKMTAKFELSYETIGGQYLRLYRSTFPDRVVC